MPLHICFGRCWSIHGYRILSLTHVTALSTIASMHHLATQQHGKMVSVVLRVSQDFYLKLLQFTVQETLFL